MDPRLRDFLAMAEARPFAWGEWDCCIWLAEWGRVLTGLDGAETWRGRYRTAMGCQRLLKREGGVLAVVERGAVASGMRSLTRPAEGAVGVVKILGPRGEVEAGGIYTGKRWAVLAYGGGLIAGSEAPVDAMWGL